MWTVNANKPRHFKDNQKFFLQNVQTLKTTGVM